MKKSSPTSRPAGRRPKRPGSGAKQQSDIAARLSRLDELKPKSAQAASLIGLLRSWLTDESGYDEQTWPKLKKALDQERRRVGARRLFNG